MKRLLLTFLILNSSFLISSAQNLGADLSAEYDFKLTRSLSLSADTKLRTADTFDKWSLGASADYKLTTWLKATAGAEFILDHTPTKTKLRDSGTIKWQRHAYTAPKYRAYTALTANYKINRWKLTLRERYQYTFKPSYNATRDYYTSDGEYNYSEDDPRDAEHTHTLRTRLSASYNIKHSPITPYASAEIYNNLNPTITTNKIRIKAGINYKINKQFNLALAIYYLPYSQ